MEPEYQLFDDLSTKPRIPCTVHYSTCSPIVKLSPQSLQRSLSLATEDNDICVTGQSSTGCGDATQTRNAATFLAPVDRQPHIALPESAETAISTQSHLRLSLETDATILAANPGRAADEISFSQMKQVLLTISTNEEWLAAEQLLQQPAPFLESFSLSVDQPQGQDRRRRRSYLKNLFCGCAPRLRRLEVRNCQFDLTPKAYFNLTSLVLDGIQFMPISHLFDVLRNMKFLEKLYIIRAAENVVSPDFHSPLPTSDPPVYMPNLNGLTVDGPISLCASILTKLEMRESCTVKLWCRNTHKGRDFSDILTRLQDIQMGSRCDYATRQWLHINTTHVKFVRQGVENRIAGDSESDHCPTFELAFFWPRSPYDIDLLHSLLPDVLNTFQECAPPETLTLFADAEVPHTIRPILHRWFRQLDDIQAIEFVGEDAFALCVPLPRPNKPSRSSRKGILLPDFTDLIFVGVNFTSPKRHHWTRLMKFLVSRPANDPILYLEFNHCVGDFDQNLPGRFGCTVRVDGQDLPDDDDGEDSDCTIQGAYDSD